MKRKMTFPAMICALALAMTAAGCGGVSYRDSVDQESGSGGGFPGGWPTPGGDGSGGDDGGPNTGGLGIPPEEYHWTKSGDGSADSAPYTVQTDDILRVRVEAGDGSIAITGNGTAQQYPGSYSCMRLAVSVNGGPAKMSPTIRRGNGWQTTIQCNLYGQCWQSYQDCCSQAPTSHVFNFSSDIQHQVGQNKNVKVTAVSIPRVQGCTLQPLYSYTSPDGKTKTAHVVNGVMKLQTNSTDGF